MGARTFALRAGLVSLALLATIGPTTKASPQAGSSEETSASVLRMLGRLPYYGVFDYLVFRIDGHTLYLSGYSFEGRLKADAEMAARRASGVEQVVNKIEVLPPSQFDDQIRWTTYYRIYSDTFLQRYAPGGVFG